jgi:Tol biopolymer transport system component
VALAAVVVLVATVLAAVASGSGWRSATSDRSGAARLAWMAFVAKDPLGVQFTIAGVGPSGSGRRLIGSRPPTVPGLWGASDPSWSPDGRRIAFEGNGEIWVMDADGGNARRLVAAGRFEDSEPAWSPDGRAIAFTRTRGIEEMTIAVASADGSNVRELTRGDDPSWSPDGSKLVFSRIRTGGGAAIFVVDANGEQPRQLTRRTGEFDPAWSPSGEIAFIRDDDIYVMKADGTAAHRVTRGDPLLIDSDPAWAPDGRRIAFDRDGAVFVVNRDGSGLRRLVRGTGNSIPTPAWSPDGQTIGYTQEIDDEIYVVRADGRGLRPITHNSKDDAAPQWSPGGRRLAFIETTAPPVGHIVVSKRDGSGRRRLANGIDSRPRWSPDGHRIAFLRRSSAYVIGADGKNMRRLPPAGPSVWDLTWSPDGRRVALAALPPLRLELIDVNRAARRGTIALPKTRFGVDRFAAVWSPTGPQIAFSVSGRNGPSLAFMVNADGSGLRTVNRGAFGPTWSPDGRLLALSRANGIRVSTADGRRQWSLPTGFTPSLQWSPNSRQIAFTRDSGIWVVGARGGRPRKLVGVPGVIDLAWSQR